MTMNDELTRGLVFAILMENGDGIMGKHPKYILEKMTTVMKGNYPTNLLDARNMAKLEQWIERWKNQMESE